MNYEEAHKIARENEGTVIGFNTNLQWRWMYRDGKGYYTTFGVTDINDCSWKLDSPVLPFEKENDFTIYVDTRKEPEMSKTLTWEEADKLIRENEGSVVYGPKYDARYSYVNGQLKWSSLDEGEWGYPVSTNWDSSERGCTYTIVTDTRPQLQQPAPQTLTAGQAWDLIQDGKTVVVSDTDGSQWKMDDSIMVKNKGELLWDYGNEACFLTDRPPFRIYVEPPKEPEWKQVNMEQALREMLVHKKTIKVVKPNGCDYVYDGTYLGYVVSKDSFEDKWYVLK